MKKFYMTMAAMLCGVAAMAQNTLYVEDITVKPGETIQLPVGLKNADGVASFSFRFGATPEGITIDYKKKSLTYNEERLDLETARIAADDDELEYDELWEFNVTKSQITFGCSIGGYRDESGNWISVAFLGNDGPVLYAPLTVAEGTEEGAYTVQLENISIADTQFKPASIADAKVVEYTINVGDGTGINSINAADSKAPVYNVAGQRVSKAQRGVYIQNGKKIAVK